MAGCVCAYVCLSCVLTVLDVSHQNDCSLFLFFNQWAFLCCVFQLTGSVYDFYFYKHGSGQWNMWTECITKEEQVIPPGAKVHTDIFHYGK